MTRRAEPSEEQLRSNIAKRMFIPTSNLPSTQEDSSSSSNNKRLFIPRGGLPSHTATSSTSKKRVYTPANLPLFKRPLRQHARDLLSHLVGRVDAVLGVNDAVNGGGKHRHGGGGTGDDSTNPTGGTCTTGTTGSSDLAGKVHGILAYSGVNRRFYFPPRWQHIDPNRHWSR